MLEQNLTQILRFQEAKTLSVRYQKKSVILQVVKTSKMEVCPKCATPSESTYDHRNVTIKDEPLGNRQVLLEIRKRRFWCKKCEKAFTEPVTGIRKGHKTSERFKRAILKAC